MKSRKKLFWQSKILLLLLLLCFQPDPSFGKKKAQPVDRSIHNVPYRDSIRQVRFNEVDFIIEQIEKTYVSGHRGMSDAEWNRRKKLVYKVLDKIYFYDNEYLFALRYLGSLKQDAHFSFPDDGMLNRGYAFSKNDTIFPLWVHTWKDGTVYNIKDYTGVIPKHAEIITVNGYSAKNMALSNRAMAPGEQANAMAMMNAKYEADPCSWPNFSNYLFAERINYRFKVVYRALEKEEPDTVILRGISRGDKYKLFKKQGDKRLSKKMHGFPLKPIVYTHAGDGIGVLTIHSFWGKRWSAMLLFGKDWRYKRLLRQAMRRIDKDQIQNLVIDISLNPGGMTENVYYTLNYLTDKTIDIRHIYHVTDNNRELMQANMTRSPELSQADREYLVGYMDSLPDGRVFCTDTVRRLQYIPTQPKHRFNGNVYLLTGNQTYSAAQMFARYCQTLGIGQTAGAHCGGYNDITGNAAHVTLLSLRWAKLEVPFSVNRICKEDDPYDYPTVDFPIEIRFEEWLNQEDHSRNRLIEIIRNQEKTLSTSPN